ncbi:MAG TPA: sulfatase [Ktedonobacteraceae bacterium]|nr:sulfatase [Ktedonobacteraceae bacterium]
MRLDRPNILYIHSHDTGRYVQPYGFAIPTPHIQQLAEEGVLFRKAFCAAPTCSPSRASLLTGQHAHNSGMLGLAHRGFSLRNPQQHILYTLRKEGYRCALIGEEHIAKDHTRIGYDRVYEVDGFHAQTLAPIAAKSLHTIAQPFFLSVGFFETHREFLKPPSKRDAQYSRPPVPLPDTPETRRDMGAFKASAWQLDWGIGTVLQALEESGLAENTLVICTTDHGIAFPRMKGNLTDHGIGVMLILRGPGGFTGGKVCDALVSHIDLFPTICDLLRIDRPHWLQGVSLLPLIRGEVEQVRETIFAEVTYHAAYEPQRAVRTQRWKYIRRFDHHLGPVLPNCDDSPSKDVLIQYGWRERSRPLEQLYDLIFDPNEACNMANDLSVAVVLEDMRTRLDDWMRETDDPLLGGPVAAPPGSELNDPDQLSPSYPTRFV